MDLEGTNGGGGREGWWTRRLFPVTGAVFASAVCAVVVANLHSLLGVGSTMDLFRAPT